ncbi:unnamed protein product, partial [marine sediment metagenome]
EKKGGPEDVNLYLPLDYTRGRNKFIAIKERW